MNDGNWILDNLEFGLEQWNNRLLEIWRIITMSPADFHDGAVWRVMVNINGGLQAIAFALLVLFFLIGVVKTAGNFAELKKPEMAVKMFIRFALAKAAVSYGMDLLLSLFSIVQGVMSTIATSAGFSNAQASSIPDAVRQAVGDVGFLNSIGLWLISLIGVLVMVVLSLLLILQVYSRFFKLYIYTAIAPIPLASFAGEPSAGMGKSFIKSYVAVCLEGAVIIISCIIFSLLASSIEIEAGASASSIMWTYIVQVIFNMLILVGTIRMSDRLIREAMGLN